MGALKLSYYQQEQGLLEKNPFFLDKGLEKKGIAIKNRLSAYRYGFNGMEKDDEVYSSEGTSYDFGARFYNPRVGRWLSVDLLEDKYPDLSPYVNVANSPLAYYDPDGNIIKIYYDTGETDTNGEPIFAAYEYKSGMKKPKDKFVRKTVRGLNKMHRNKRYDTQGIVKALASDEDNTVGIYESHGGNAASVGALVRHNDDGTAEMVSPDGFEMGLWYNTNEGYISEDGTQRQSAGMTLLHELAHSYYIIYDPEGHVAEYNEALKNGTIGVYLDKMEKDVGDYDTYSDQWIIENVENPVKKEGNRKDHNSGSFLKTKGGLFSKRGKEKRKPGSEKWILIDPKSEGTEITPEETNE